MSSFGTFSGFGQSSGQNTGGFGNTSNTSGNAAFGSGFGSSSTNNNPFGGARSSSSFGSGGAFGQNQGGSSLFGQNKSSFGTNSSSGTGLFGNAANTSSSGFGSTPTPFGGNPANSTTINPFGGGTPAGGLSFGQSKPTFNGGGASGTGLFGTAAGTSGNAGFGTTQSNPFGQAGVGTALGPGVPPSEGTAVTPYTVTNEKDPSGSGTNSFQSINFMPAYSKYSFEELRLADYDKGRRFGNGSGQAGGFGGGGFGAGGATTFGAQSNTPFGGNTNATAFGGNASGGNAFGSSNNPGGFGGGSGTSSLFSANSSQSGGLFSAQSKPTSSGLLGNAGGGGGFGNSGSGTGAFGAASGTSNAFGSNSAPNKPGPFGTAPGGGSGSGGLFGAGSGGQTGQSAFATNQPTQNPNPFGALGAQNQQGQDQNKSGGLFGNGGFGASQTSQPQPSGGLFGAAQPSGGGGGLFGGGGNAASGQGSNTFGGGSGAGAGGGGLFGPPTSQQPKPGLFGGGGGGGGAGGFGSAQNQSTGGLFGGAGGTNQQQQGGGLFGGASNTSSGLFGTSQQQPKPGLFGSTLQNTSSQGNGLFGGQSTNPLLSTSQQNQQTSQQGQGLHSSLLDGNPFGQSSIWSGLPEATPQNSGPLVTPLSASQRLKEIQMKAKPPFKFSSASLQTPPRQGYGFSYSAYGSPNSAASTPTGGGLSSGSTYSRGFTGGSFGRSMAKSFSASNLRQQYSADGESVLSPGAFAPGSSFYSSGSIRRLTIDRNLKTDLFSHQSTSLPALPSSSNNTVNGAHADGTNGETANDHAANEQLIKLKKRVSFDQDTTGGVQDGNGNDFNGARDHREPDNTQPTAAEQGYLRSSRWGKTTNGTSSAPPPAEQVRGNELAVVPEDHESENVVSKMRLPSDAPAAMDSKPGEYWMKPSRAELSQMPREQLQHFKGLQVGRQGCGDVTFDEEVDLTAIHLDDLFGKLIDIRIRSITVYPDASTKPPPGKGLNVPSTLCLENSWPRARGRPTSATSGPLFNKHVLRLKQMDKTNFISYDTQTGVWTFTVDHYTRYGLDYDDEDSDNEVSQDKAPANDATEADWTPGDANANVSGIAMDLNENAADESSPVEDTFAFKQTSMPGWFGGRSILKNNQDLHPSAGPTIDALSGVDPLRESSAANSDDEMSMVGAFPRPNPSEGPQESPDKLAVKKNQRPWDTPTKPLIDLDGDWTEHLQRTISPRKQNREALRDVQGKVLLDRGVHFAATKQQTVGNHNEIRTNIDLMNSLFGQHGERVAMSRKQDELQRIECPYPKRAKTFDVDAEMSAPDQQWHESFPVKWTPTGSLLYARTGPLTPHGEQAWTWKDERLDVGQKRDIWRSRLLGDGRSSYSNSEWGWHNATIDVVDGVPFAKQKPIQFASFCRQIIERGQRQGQTAESRFELDIYRLAHVLFDGYDDHFSKELSPSQKSKYADRIRKDRLSEFWATLVQERRPELLQQPNGTLKEEQIIVLLSAHQVPDASRHLTEHGSLRLSTMIAQLDEADELFQSNVADQLQAWRDQNIVSEMSEPIRALYELLAGNTTISVGNQQGPFENRASTFSISERFELDWIQAFGLCLWYGHAKHRDIEDVVQDFAGKLAKGHESAKPYADGMTNGQHRHPLWVLLQLYAATQGSEQDTPILPPALTPLAHHFDNRIPFQLHHALTANIPTVPVDKALADKLAIDLAFQLSASSFHVGAIFALMHLSDPHVRAWHIRDLLIRYAPLLPGFLDHETGAADETWLLLIEKLKIPMSWICKAKAIHYRAQHHSLHELKFLLVAGEWTEAHDCLCRRVAPRAVLEEDWAVIREIIGQFEHQIKESVANWTMGGGMYADFVALIDPQGHKSNKAERKWGRGRAEEEPQDEEQERTARIKRLHYALAEVAREFKKRGSHLTAGGDAAELEQRVACHEMARMLADLVAREQESDKEKGNSDNSSKSNAILLDLPLTADIRLRHAKSMAVDHYRAVMATVRAH